MTEQTPEGQFDPSAHTVAEVNDYLATADETERQRVLDAEAAGQDRSTIKAPSSTSTEGDAQTVTEAGANQAQTVGDQYDKGYVGHVPSRDGDNTEDLTLAGVTGQNQES